MTVEPEVRYVYPLGGSPLVPMAHRALADIQAAGHCGPYVMLGWDNHGLGAFVGGELVGLLVWADSEWKGEFNILVGYVKPEQRHQGIYRLLWEALVAKAQEKGRARIEGTTHALNIDMQHVMEKLGRELRYYGYVYDVPPGEKDTDE